MMTMSLLAWRETDRNDLANMMASGSLDFAAMDAIINDITEIRVNLEEAEWNELLIRYSMLIRNEL